jgi:adenylate cyclase
MDNLWQIHVYEDQHLVHAAEISGAVELGRQATSRETAGSQTEERPGYWRVIVGRREEQNISRRHVLLEPLAESRARVTNQSTSQAVRFSDGAELAPQAVCERPLPLVLALGGKTVEIQDLGSIQGPLQSLASLTCPPGTRLLGDTMPSPLAALPSRADNQGAIEAMLRWMQGVLEVLQSAAGSSDFFDKAASALVQLVGLDHGWVLLRDGGEFKTQAAAHAPDLPFDPDSQPSRRVLHLVSQQKRTLWQVPEQPAGRGESLREVNAVVAAPILDRSGEVIGALYGDRLLSSAVLALRKGDQADSSRLREGPISRHEAVLVEVLAVGVAAGLARVKEEQAALRARVQFEQFFTRELSLQLAAQPDLLQGRESEVTLLFCDVRGFSRISERLGPGRTVEWLQDVMGALSECVFARHGVLVEYLGDELIAMWGAPAEQPEHPALACRAALDMLEQLPRLNERWQPVLGEPTDLGIGINTGVARVGNIGTPRKFKYGPLGNTVNLASRVQGATKYLKSRLLITEATQGRLGAGFLARRLCRVRVVHIAEPVGLYELMPPEQPDAPAVKETYEKALAEFEQRHFRVAARLLAPLIGEDVNDGPSLVLMSRIVNALVEDAARFEPVWELPGK